MAVFFNEGFIDKIKENKARKAYDKLSPEEKKNVKREFDKKVKEFDNLVIREEIKLRTNPSYVKKIRKALDDAYKDGYLDPKDPDEKAYYKNNRIPRLISKYEGSYWVILEEPQSIRVVLCFICSDLEKTLSKITEYKLTSGDGDEGCIYPDAFVNGEWYFYTHYYKK